MAILLTGGSGFIGSHFHQSIPNDQIVNLDLVPPFFQAGSKYIKGDIRIREDVRNAVRNYDVKTILSLAAKHHDFGIGHSEYFDTNEEGTRVLCDIASEFDIKEIVFYSSVAVYGMRDTISDETKEPRPDGPYGASKLAGEKVLMEWASRDSSRKVLIIRPTIVFGANNRANMFNLIKQIDSGFYFHLGKADNVKSIAYVENLVAATLYLKGKLKPGVEIFNYADEPQLTSRVIAESIAQFLGKKIRFTIPKWLGTLAGLPFDLAIKLTGKNLPISTARIKKLGTATHHSAKKLLSTSFVPIYTSVDGLEKMVKWYEASKANRPSGK